MKQTLNSIVVATLLLASASVFAANKEVSIDTHTNESGSAQASTDLGKKVHQFACKILGPLGLSGCKGAQ